MGCCKNKSVEAFIQQFNQKRKIELDKKNIQMNFSSQLPIPIPKQQIKSHPHQIKFQNKPPTEYIRDGVKKFIRPV